MIKCLIKTGFSGSLSEQLESISRPFSNSNGHGHSLLTEMDLSATSSGHGSAASGAGSASSPHSHPSIQDDIEIDDIECDDPHADTSLIVEQQNHKVSIVFRLNSLAVFEFSSEFSSEFCGLFPTVASGGDGRVRGAAVAVRVHPGAPTPGVHVAVVAVVV